MICQIRECKRGRYFLTLCKSGSVLTIECISLVHLVFLQLRIVYRGPESSANFFHVKYVIKPITFGEHRLSGFVAVCHLLGGILSWRITGLLTSRHSLPAVCIRREVDFSPGS